MVAAPRWPDSRNFLALCPQSLHATRARSDRAGDLPTSSLALEATLFSATAMGGKMTRTLIVMPATYSSVEPRWSPRGDELFYVDRNAGTLMTVPVQTRERFLHRPPRPLFGVAEYDLPLANSPNYDVAPDGRFIFKRSAARATRAARSSSSQCSTGWKAEPGPADKLRAHARRRPRLDSRGPARTYPNEFIAAIKEG